MLAGHIHKLFVSKVGDEKWGSLGQPCTVISGSDIKENYHAGCGVVFSKSIEAKFYDSNGEIQDIKL